MSTSESPSRPRRRYVFALTAVVLLLNLGIGYRVYSREAADNGEQDIYARIAVMMRVLHLIRQNYVDVEKIADHDLISAAINGMVGSLDPFSGYLSKIQYRQMLESTEGHFGGIGVVISTRNDQLTIVTPLENTPGSRAGFLPGDVVLAVDGQTTESMGVSEAVKLIKGEPGTFVVLRIYRPSTAETLEKRVVRAVIEVPSVTNVQLLAETIGYINITQFNETTGEEMRTALEQLESQGMKALIIDLRNNPGGLLNAAVDVCSLFLRPRSLIVTTEGRTPSQKQSFYTGGGRKVKAEIPIAILVNQGSASAAEIVAGCLQDWGRALLIGMQTFGKGSVQNLIELPDGSALRLTTAKYYTPSQRVIHEHGIAPDITVELSNAELQQMAEAQMQASSMKVDPKIDRQLQRALDTLQSYDAFLRGRQSNYGKLRQEAKAPDEQPL